MNSKLRLFSQMPKIALKLEQIFLFLENDYFSHQCWYQYFRVGHVF